jgi:hypothetical protein
VGGRLDALRRLGDGVPPGLLTTPVQTVRYPLCVSPHNGYYAEPAVMPNRSLAPLPRTRFGLRLSA